MQGIVKVEKMCFQLQTARKDEADMTWCGSSFETGAASTGR